MKISVIIPTYNGEETIERALRSVFNQEFDVEVLICDDCSTDNTVRICRNYMTKIFINSTNSGGPNKGRNTGILHAAGEYVAFLDQDDEWLPGKLAKQISVDADVVYSQPLGSKNTPAPNLYEAILKKDNKRYGFAYLSSLLIKNNNIPLFEEHFGQLDFDWILRLTRNRICVQVDPVVVRYNTQKNLSLDPEYRRRDFYMSLLHVDGDVKTIKRIYASRGRYHYVMGECSMARFYFMRGELNWKTVLYYISSFNNTLRKLIIKKYKVFG